MIDMQVTDEQEVIIEAVALFLAERLPVSRYRKADPGAPLDLAMLKEIAGMGWIGLGISEDLGGHGRTFIDDMLVCRELGRGLAPMPLFAAIVGARLTTAAGRADLAKRIIDGDGKVAIAIRCGDTSKQRELLVVDAPDADWLVGLTADGAYLASCACGPGALLPATDVSIDLAHRTIGENEIIVRLGRSAFDESVLLGTSLLVGMAEATRDMAVGYAKNREQFGQPIGAFQAIKHICADMALRAEAAKCLLFFAGIEFEGKSAAARMHISAAKVMAADASMLNAQANIQIHGGAGFTFESDAHLYVKRAHVLEQILGPQHRYRSVLGSGSAMRIAP